MDSRQRFGITIGAILTSIAVLLAALSIISAQDRIAANAGEGANAYLGGLADVQRATNFLGDRDLNSTLPLARRAVRTAPIEASASSTLGSAMLLLGQFESANSAFRVSGALGWRDVPTQLYWLAASQAAGDPVDTQDRIDALLRQSIDDPAVEQALLALTKTTTGQSALVALLSKRPPWEEKFIRSTAGLSDGDLENRLAVIAKAAEASPVDCTVVGETAGQLLRRDITKGALRLWRDSCGGPGNHYLVDGGFEAASIRGAASPFSWQFASIAGLDSDITAAPKPLTGRALRVTSSRTVRTMVAHEAAILEPGRYEVFWRTAKATGTPDASLSVAVTCNGQTLTPTQETVATGPQNLSRASFSVPEKACDIQAISVQKAADSYGSSSSSWIDDISIRKVIDGQ